MRRTEISQTKKNTSNRKYHASGSVRNKVKGRTIDESPSKRSRRHIKIQNYADHSVRTGWTTKETYSQWQRTMKQISMNARIFCVSPWVAMHANFMTFYRRIINLGTPSSPLLNSDTLRKTSSRRSTKGLSSSKSRTVERMMKTMTTKPSWTD